MLSRISQVVPTSGLSVADCNSDKELINLWLHDKTPNTVDAYRRDVEEFRWFIEDKPLARVVLNDLYFYSDALIQQGRAPATVNRKLSAVKSLLSYGVMIGYLPLNAGAALKLPKLDDSLADRILSESQVLRLIDAANPGRDRTLLRFLYESGCRVSELVNLTWKNLQRRDDAGQVRIVGKGNNTRVVLLTPQLWADLKALRGKAPQNDPVFKSLHSGQKLRRSDVNDLVTRVAKKAGIEGNVSPHWFRHAHASHSLERGAPIHLVQATLGHRNLQTTGRYLHARPTDSSARYLPR
ncbi:MAG: tyrosine-type recombinase/integrase [Cyanobacteriota bacterium]